MSYKFFSSPSNHFRQSFKERFPDITASHWRELLAATAGLATTGSLHKYAQASNCDDMFKANAIILDRERFRMRLEDFKIPFSDELLDEVKMTLHNFWNMADKPCPPMYWSIREYLTTSPVSDYRMQVPMKMFPYKNKFLLIWGWLSKLDISSIPEFPSGPIIVPTGNVYYSMQVKMKIVDKGPEDLPEQHQHQFPADGFPAWCFFEVLGTRGVSFAECEEPEPEQNHDDWNTDEDSEDEDENDDSEVDMNVPLGATCEFHDDELAIASTDSGYLCEDCYSHYVDGYIQED